MAKGENKDMIETEAFKVSANNYRTITDGDVSGAFASIAYDHDSVATDNLIRYFHFAMEDGALFESYTKFSQKERTFLDFIKRAFGRYMEGKSLNAAFGLTPGRGESHRDDNTLRNMGIAAFVILRMRNGTKWQDAIGDAANKFFPDGEGTRACESAHAEYKELFISFTNDSLQTLARSNDSDLSV